MVQKKQSHSSFSGQLGFIMAAAGSAVGLGNIWRFPYLAAKDGGGLFLIVYLVLVLTFGFTLLVNDIAIGRHTQKSPIQAYEMIKPGWGFLGRITFLVPAIIMTYYAVIGGWVLKYITIYFIGEGHAAASSNYFSSFITSPISPIIYGLIFMILTAIIVYRGVQNGIEKFSKVCMPILLVMIIAIAVFSLTLKHTENGVTRTGLQGLAVYLVPNFHGMTIGKFLSVLLDAMSQLFFSLSVSMGIMVTYGSYVKKDIDLNHSINMIEIFDTLIAFLAGLMIIPSIYVFTGKSGMTSGPSLIFVSLPKIFNAMGKFGIFFGAAFFIMVAFAALTSCISVLETLVADCSEIFKAPRKKVTLILTIIYSIATIVITLGYTVFYFELKLPNGATGQLLDLADYLSNSVLMPITSLLSCVLIGWVVKPKLIIDEMELNGETFRRKKIYVIMVKYIAPVIMVILFLQSTGFWQWLLHI
ncbi:sodium-dependent transporter [Pseudoramibacter sp.]|jgi:NSS family neurotransmitter:Na+ symporter|uniref:sodium-dependent transporter n=1 Tax=Pseudoramibacter sp. TaxID=2034862 RepID=UPI0025FB5806|nr:sodium-dependent transporter [Pseudoramibacter sp.]MCH4072813.1 sodium-dependent transporter [Pseudoramibacter sp.]MCH4106584.1 sodium-dependent transporter [Pseudoramibacter sp.]